MTLEHGRVHIGDARELAGQLVPGSVQTIVTSPPYWNLRSYLPDDHADKAREMGSEATPDEFVAQLVALFAALRPALRDDGILWLNLGDSYANDTKWGGATGGMHAHGLHGNTGIGRNQHKTGLPHKSLVMIPHRVALALQADGWIVRMDNVWHKPSPMPESVADRPTKAHEYIFLIAKTPHYFYDAEAVREKQADFERGARGQRVQLVDERPQPGVRTGTLREMDRDGSRRAYNPAGRNKRSVWTIASAAFPDAHYATFPPELARICLMAGTSAHGACAACGAPWQRVVARVPVVPDSYHGSTFTAGKTGAVHSTRGQGPRYSSAPTGMWEPTCRCSTTEVRPCVAFDPFMGSGTVAQVAHELGLDWIGFDLDERSIGWTNERLRALPVRSLFAAT